MIRSLTVTILAVIFAFGTLAAQTQTKKAPATTKKPAAASKTAPAKKSTAKTTKKSTAKKAVAKPAADTTAKPMPPAPVEPAKTEPAKTDTASSPSLKEYTKTKINELGAAKDTLLKSGSDKLGTTKENLGKKLKDFDPFKKSKADTTKSK